MWTSIMMVVVVTTALVVGFGFLIAALRPNIKVNNQKIEDDDNDKGGSGGERKNGIESRQGGFDSCWSWRSQA